MNFNEITGENKKIIMEKESLCILVPSHLTNRDQIQLLINCITSLVDQDVIVPIMVSISSTNKNFIKILESMLSKNKLCEYDIKFVYHNKKLSQFEHINYMYINFGCNYDWILFCDDDDTYHHSRVGFFNAIISKHKEEHGSKSWSYPIVEDQPSHNYSEYWLYCASKEILGRFLKIVNDYNPKYIKHKFCDMVFVFYMKLFLGYGNTGRTTVIPLPLYNYNERDNSTTGKIFSISNKNKQKNMEQRHTYFDRTVYNQCANKSISKQLEKIFSNLLLYVCGSCRGYTLNDMLKKLLPGDIVYDVETTINQENKKVINDEFESIHGLCFLLENDANTLMSQSLSD